MDAIMSSVDDTIISEASYACITKKWSVCKLLLKVLISYMKKNCSLWVKRVSL